MSSFLGRNNRRRRVLNEEALSASTAHIAMRVRTPEEPGTDGPRYSEAAGVEHHPQVSDFLPRRYRAIGVLALVGLLSTAAVEVLYWYVPPAVADYGYDISAAFDLAGTGSIAAWLAAVFLLAAATTCLLIYSLRRHRIDDYRGRYRVWLAAAIACAVLSLESVAPVHRLIAAAAAYHTGWTALRGHAAWWLALGGLPLAWIALRAWLDARESRLAAAVLGASFIAYCTALCIYLGFGPTIEPQSQVMLTAGATLVGHWLLVIGVVSYGRFVVLDAQGLVTVRAPKRTSPKQAKNTRDAEVKHVEPTTSSANSTSSLRSFRQNLAQSARPVSAETKSSEWVDGSEPVSDDFDDGDDESVAGMRKLTKAERKRLRKLKTRDRAA